MPTPLNTTASGVEDDFDLDDIIPHAVSWPAIFAGGLAAIALSLALLILGSGLGFAAISPWSHTGASTTTLTLSTIIWLIVMQWLSAGVGGYLTGRLRARWPGTHPHEVFFRDTAHGLLTWALASVVTAALLVSVISSIVGGAAHAAMPKANGSKTADSTLANPFAYYVDSLFRQDQATTPPTSQDIRTETARILVKDLKNGTLPDDDKAYISKLVAEQTGVSQDIAARHVDTIIAQINSDETKAKEAAEAVRKTSASLSIFTALSMFIGAFIACLTAALGGKCRDDDKAYIG